MLGEFEADRLRQLLLDKNALKEADKTRKLQNAQRRRAEQERESRLDKKGSKPVFLRPSDIAGEYDVKRALTTTLGMPDGMVRKLTLADLEAFRKNIEHMQSSYVGGINVEQVISLSLQDDIDRANRQIHYAMPARQKGGLVEFITNASKKDFPKPNDPKFHRVYVEFLAFNELVFFPDQIKKTTIQNRLSKGKVKFECDCGRFNFWFRYLNTVAGTVLGRKEGGYPKIRNPHIAGMACKHILRVMHWIKSGEGQLFLANALNKERSKQYGAKHKTKKEDLSRIFAEQTVKSGTKRNVIKANLEKEVRRLEAKAKRKAELLNRKIAESNTKRQAGDKLRSLLNTGLITHEEYAVLSKNLER